MKNRKTSYAFLMEMSWICAFFLVSAAIFVLAFAKAEQMSRQAEAMDRAVTEASLVLEETFAACAEEDKDGADPETFLENVAKQAQDAALRHSDGKLSLSAELALQDNLLKIVVEARNGQETLLYTLTGERAAMIQEGTGI